MGCQWPFWRIPLPVKFLCGSSTRSGRFRRAGSIPPMTQNQDLFARSPSLLRMPSWLGPDVHEEMALAFEPGDYKITPGDRWTVVLLRTGETVYSGIGPVEILRSSV